MKKSYHSNQLDWVDLALAVVAIALSFAIVFYRKKLLLHFGGDLEIVPTIFFSVGGISLTLYILLFRQFGTESDKLDKAAEDLAQVQGKSKNDIESRTLYAIEVIDKVRKNLLYFFFILFLIAMVTWFIYKEELLIIAAVLSVVFIANIASYFRQYFKTKGAVRRLRREVIDISEKYKKQSALLSDLDDGSISSPIKNTDHIQSYTKKHH